MSHDFQNFHPVVFKAGVDPFLQGRLCGISCLDPLQEAVMFCFIVIHAYFNPDKAIGDKQERVLGIERHPSQIGKPDFDPMSDAP